MGQNMNRKIVTALALLLLLSGSRAFAIIQVAEGGNNISVPTIARNAVNEPMLQLNFFNPPGDPGAEITAVTVTASGTGNDLSDLASGGVKLYWDKDNNGRLTTGGATPDVLLGSGDYSADNGTLAFSGLSVPLPTNTSLNLIVLYTLGPSATAGKNFRARVATNVSMSVRNSTTLAPLSVTGAPVQGFVRAVGAGKITFVRIAQNPDGAVAIPNRPRVPLINLQVINDDVEDIAVTSFDFLDIGTTNAVTGMIPNTVRLYNQTAVPTGSSTPIASGSFASDNGRVTLTPTSPLTITRNTSIKIWVTFDVVAQGAETIGNTYQIQVPGTNPLNAAGATSTDTPSYVGTSANGPQWEFNYNPIVFSLPSDLGAIFMPSTAQNYPMLGFQVHNDPDGKGETAAITQFTFHADGTMNDTSAITSIKLYRDLNLHGKFDAADILLGSGTISADNGSVTINFAASPINLGIGGVENFLVTYDLNGSAIDGQTARLSLQTRDDMIAMGAVSLANGSLVPSPFMGAIKTVGQPRAQLTLEVNQDKIPGIVAPAAVGFPVFGFIIKNGTDEDMLLKGVNLALTGPLNEVGYFDKFQVWFDNDGDGVQDAGVDSQIGGDATLTPSGSDAMLLAVAPDDQAYLVPRGQQVHFTLYGDVSNTVLGDGTETFNIVGADDNSIVAVGAGSGAQFSFTTAQPPFSVPKTIRNPVISLTGYPGPTSVTGCINAGYGFVGNSFMVPSGEDLLIQRVRFSVSGTLNDPQFITDGFVWQDKNKNLFVDQSEISLVFGIHDQSNPVSVDDGQGLIDLSADPGVVTRNKSFEMSVGLGFSAPDPAIAQAQKDKTITVSQIGNLVIEGVGARSGRPIEVTNPVLNDQGRTMTFSVGSVTISQRPIIRTSGPPNGTNLEVLSLLFKTEVLEDVRIDQLTIRPMGTLNESLYIRPGGIKLYIDDNKNGKLDTGDYLYGIADPPATDNGPITFTPANFNHLDTVYSFPAGGHPYDQFIMTVDLTADAPEGTTLQFQVQSPSDVVLSGACSLFPYNNGVQMIFAPDAPPLVGPSVLVQRGAVDIRTDSSFANDVDNQPEVIMAPGAAAYEVVRLDVKATNAENVNLRGITIRSTGAANELADLAPVGVALYKNVVQAANLLTSGTFTMNDGSVTLTNFSQTITLDPVTPVDLRLAFTGSGVGQLGNDFNLTIAGADLDAIGLSSGLPITSVVPAEPYAAIPIRFGGGKIYIRLTDTDGFLLPIPTGQPSQIQRVRFAASRTEDLRVEDLSVRAAGTADETLAFDSAALKMDERVGANPPVLIGSAPVLPGDNGTADLRNLDIIVPAGKDTGTQYSLDAVMNAAGTVLGTTLRMDLESTGTMRVVGMLSGVDVPIVLEDYAGGDSAPGVPYATGRTVTLSTGLITLKKGNVNPVDHIILGNDQKIPLMQIRATIQKDLEGITITDIRICAGGTADETALIQTLYLYTDVDEDGRATAADVLIGTATFDADNGMAHFGNLMLTYPQNTTVNWIVAADLTGNAQPGQTIQMALCAANPISGTGQLTTAPISVAFAAPPPLSAILTIGVPTPSPTPIPRNAAQGWERYD